MNTWRNTGSSVKPLTMLLLAAVLTGFTFVLPRIPQPLEYHQFADQRACLGLRNCLNTVSNTMFILAGVSVVRLESCIVYQNIEIPPGPPFSKGGNNTSPFEKGGLRGIS